MPYKYLATAISPENKRILRRKSDKRAFVKDRMRHILTQKNLVPRTLVARVVEEMMRTGEPVEVKGWVLMIETFEE